MTVATKSRTFGEGFSRINVPIGFMLVKTIHDSYGTVVEMILELVQNAIDANAHHVAVLINKKARNITVADDGDGVSKEKYEAALQSVMRTMKSRDKLGQFGMGMLSPLAKCEWHKLTSCPKDGQTYLEWVFNTEEIRSQDDYPNVPHRVRTDLRFETDPRGSQKGVTLVSWRTLVEVHKYTDDKYISRMPSAQNLFDEIAQNYREKMLENNVKISIKITSEKGEVDSKDGFAEPYYGHRLPDMKLYDGNAGHSFFHLYLARKGEKGYLGPGVSMGEADNAYRFTFKSFARSVAGLLPSSVIEALNSGVFEGDILTERTKLHSNRKSFEPGDALLGFCQAIETWYDRVGKQHYEAAVDSRSEEHYKALGEDLKKTLEGFLNDPKFQDILKPFKSNLGLVVKNPHKDGDEEAQKKKPEPQQGEEQIVDEDEGDEDEENVSDPKKKKKRKKRKPRAKVKSEQLGIEFRYEDIYDERRLWEYEQGVLTFNILHSKWRACEKSQRRLKQLQELVGVKVIMLQMMPEGEWRDHAESYAEELVDPFIYLLQSSPNFQHISRMKGKKDAD